MTGLWWAPVLLSNQAYWGSGTDLVVYQYPIRSWVFDCARHGYWPLWNPYLFNGLPFWGTGFQSPLHPFSWIGALLPVVAEVKVTVWLSLTLLGLGMDRLLALRGEEPLACRLGGVAACLGSTALMRVYAGHLDVIVTMAHLPWLVGAVLLAQRQGTLRSAARASLMLGLTVLSGHYHMLYLGLWWAYWLSLEERPPGLVWLRQWALVAALGLAMVSFQWLGLSQSLERTTRHRLSDVEVMQDNPAPAALLTALVPSFYGGGGEPSWAPWPTWEGRLYVGLLPLALLPFGARRSRWAAAGVASSLLLALGPPGGVYSVWALADPLVRSFRCPYRFALVAVWLGLTLAARGLSHCLRENNRQPVSVLLALAVLAQVLAAVLPTSLYQAAWHKPAPLPLPSGGSQLVVTALSCAMAALLGQVLRNRRRFGYGLIALAALESIVLGAGQRQLHEAADFQVPVAIQQAADANPQLRWMWDPALQWVDRAVPGRIASVGGYERLVDRRYVSAAAWALGMDPSQAGIVLNVYGTGPFWTLQGVALAAGQVEPYADWKVVQDLGPVRIYRHEGMERAFLVFQAEAARADEALQGLAAGNLDGRAQVYAEPSDFDALLKHLGQQPDAPPQSKLTCLEFFENRLSYRVESDQPAVLVLTDAPYPGWTARVDGVATSLYAVNGGLHRAVAVPKGSHTVEMSYRPPLWEASWALAGVAFLLALIAGAVRPRGPAGGS